jgi:X-domain of DnaJ-containing
VNSGLPTRLILSVSEGTKTQSHLFVAECECECDVNLHLVLLLASVKEQADMEFRNEDGGDDENLNTEEAHEKYRKRTTAAAEADKFKQRKREVICAINLRARVEPFVDGTQEEEEFVALCQAEAATITKGVFGHVYCSAIGYALEVEADEFIGYQKSFLGMDGHAARIKKRAHAINSDMKLVGAGITAARAGRQAFHEVDKIQKEAKSAMAGKDIGSNVKGGTDSDDDAKEEQSIDSEKTKVAAEKIEASLPVFLELAWAINERDITRTLKNVCQKLFLDAAVPLEVRLKRAEGIKLLGHEFLAIGNATAMTESCIDGKEIKNRAEVAAMATLARAQGQELSQMDAEELIKQAKTMQEQEGTTSSSGPTR